MPNGNETYKYHAFLVRLWQINQGGKLVWRVTIENPHTKEIIGFETAQDFTEYLDQLLGFEGREDNDESVGNDLVT